MSMLSPEKFRWWMDQETKGMGTWLDSRVTYQHIQSHAADLAHETLAELRHGGSACTSGGCTS